MTQLHVATQARAEQLLRAFANNNPTADSATISRSITAAQQATASNYTRTRIEGALGQGDIATAAALNDRWGNDLLPADKDAVDQHLTYAGFNQDSQQATTQAMLINQPAPSNAPLGRQRNADMVLHRNGGDGAVDQFADAGNGNGNGSTSSIPPDALSPISAGPGAPEEKLDKGDRDERALQYPEGGWDEHSPGERMAVGPHAMQAEEALKNNLIQPVAASPLPIDLKVNPRNSDVGQGNGNYGDNRDGGARNHGGVDLAAPVGTPVFAVKDGTVLFVQKDLEPIPAGWDRKKPFYSNPEDGGFGNEVIIQHSDGTVTVYAHLRPIKDKNGTFVSPVSQGQQVKAGDKIGEVGTTGNLPERAASHLHFETRYIVDDQNLNTNRSGKDRTTINPLYLFRGTGITIEGRKI